MNEAKAESQLKHAAQRIALAVQPPSADLIVARGMRRRRRILVSSSLAAVAAVGAGTALVASLSGATGGRTATLVPAETPSASSSHTLSPDTYPSPRSFPDWGTASGCPSLDNVQEPTGDYAPDIRRATQSLSADAEHDRSLTDPAMWPALQQLADSTPINAVPGNTSLRPAMASKSRDLLVNNCGAELVRRSVVEVVCPSDCGNASAPALNGELVWLVRNGHWLLWFVG